MGFTMGGSYMSDRFLQTLALAAVCLAVMTHFVLGGARHLITFLMHLFGIAGGLLVAVLLDATWPRMARERAEFAASYKSQLVPGAVRVETAFTVIWLAVLVAVALSFLISRMRQESPRGRADAR
jgi:hypothetical protein